MYFFTGAGGGAGYRGVGNRVQRFLVRVCSRGRSLKGEGCMGAGCGKPATDARKVGAAVGGVCGAASFIAVSKVFYPDHLEAQKQASSLVCLSGLVVRRLLSSLRWWRVPPRSLSPPLSPPRDRRRSTSSYFSLFRRPLCGIYVSVSLPRVPSLPLPLLLSLSLFFTLSLHCFSPLFSASQPFAFFRPTLGSTPGGVNHCQT